MIVKLLLILFLALPSWAKESFDLPALIAQADRYQLPKPPADAKLILANTGWTSVIGGSSSDLDPAVYESGYLLKNEKDDTAQVLCGFTQRLAKAQREHQPATLPFTTNPPTPKSGGYSFRGGSFSTLATAIQCARLGDFKNAEALVQLLLKSDYLHGFHAQERQSHFRTDLPLFLARITYEFYYQDLRKKNPKLKQALAMLEQLQAEFPVLFSDNENNYYQKRRSLFLQDLRLTANSPPREKDSIEDLLYQAAFSNVPSHIRKPDHPHYQIYLQGTAAIPELVRLSTSRKLTPSVRNAFMNSPESRHRLGQLASQALMEMTGAGNTTDVTINSNWETWLTKIDLSNEKTFFLQVFEETKNGSQINAEVPLTILLHRFPNDALEFAKKFTTSKHRNAFIAALMASPVDKGTKAQALLALSSKQKGLDRRYMLQNLAKIEPAATVKELLPLIEALPTDVNKPYWTAQEADLTHVVVQLEEPAVWKHYLTKTKSTAIGLRMEIMNSMDYTYIGETNQKLRLAFLASFLNDEEVRTTNKNDKRWDGPHAGFTYHSLSVQNFVAEKIASLLKVPGQPGDHWTEKEWAPYRKKVEAALSKLTLPNLEEK